MSIGTATTMPMTDQIHAKNATATNTVVTLSRSRCPRAAGVMNCPSTAVKA